MCTINILVPSGLHCFCCESYWGSFLCKVSFSLAAFRISSSSLTFSLFTMKCLWTFLSLSYMEFVVFPRCIGYYFSVNLGSFQPLISSFPFSHSSPLLVLYLCLLVCLMISHISLMFCLFFIIFPSVFQFA